MIEGEKAVSTEGFIFTGGKVRGPKEATKHVKKKRGKTSETKGKRTREQPRSNERKRKSKRN